MNIDRFKIPLWTRAVFALDRDVAHPRPDKRRALPSNDLAACRLLSKGKKFVLNVWEPRPPANNEVQNVHRYTFQGVGYEYQFTRIEFSLFGDGSVVVHPGEYQPHNRSFALDILNALQPVEPSLRTIELACDERLLSGWRVLEQLEKMQLVTLGQVEAAALAAKAEEDEGG